MMIIFRLIITYPVNALSLNLTRGRRGHDQWIYNYLCNQCLSPLRCEYEPRSWRCALNTILCDKVSH